MARSRYYVYVQDDTRVVREGDKVFVITEYQVQEEEEEDYHQPKCLVGFDVRWKYMFFIYMNKS